MQLPIPDDWDGKSYFCTQVIWPDSPQFVGLLVGFLSAMTRGRYWDANTGSILEIQEIAREVFDKNFPFNDCAPGNGDNGNTSEPDIIEGMENSLIGAICMECSIPYGVLRWNDGILEYKYCGEWFAVSGDVSIPDWGDTGDEEVGDPPETREEATSCSKTLAFTSVVFGAIDVLLSQAFDDFNPWDGLSDVKLHYPSINWGDLQLFSAYMSAMKIVPLALEDEVTDASLQQEMRCRVAEVISGGDDGFTISEYESAKAAIDLAATTVFNWNDYPLIGTDMVNIYRKVAQAIGDNDTRKITTMVLPSEADNCACPSETPYDASIVFNGNYTANGTMTGTAVEAVTVEDNGQALHITLAGSNGDWRDAVDLQFELVGAVAGDDMVIRMSPFNGLECPTEEWQTFAPVTNPNQWALVDYIDVGGAPAPAISFAPGPGYMEARIITEETNDPVHWVELDCRWAPQTGGFGGQTKRYYIRLEIVEVNDVDYR